MRTSFNKTIHSSYGPTRRNFLTGLSKAVSLIGLTILSPTTELKAANARSDRTDLDTWFDKIKGQHKILYDAQSHNNGFQSIWSWVFMESNNETGTPDDDLAVVVVLRHKAAGLALEDKLWKKYKLGKFYDVRDLSAPLPAEKNPYWEPQVGEMPEDGMSIRKLIARGVLFCVCERAIANTSKQIAQSKGLDAVAVKNELMAGILPGIQPVPSGVWAIERAQQHGCAYCFAG